MKVKILFFLLSLTIIWSCGSKTETTNTEDYGEPQTQSEPVKVSENLVAQGAALVAQSDCTTCHHQTDKLIGPSHKEVAEKYAFTEENIKMLADKIVNGGTGNWGQIPMTPHPDISHSDAEKMARYVLSLDGEKEPE